MALARSPTCLSCLRRIAQPSAAALTPLSLLQVRHKVTKAELEDLQGIPVRLLMDIPTFGRKDAIIRVKPGRMRNIWFPKAKAEYMTKQRFKDMGLTEAAIGVRDRTFGTKLVLDEESGKGALKQDGPDGSPAKKKETLTLSPEETQSLLTDLLPPTILFTRKPNAAPTPSQPTPPPPPQPTTPRSPSLAANAATSTSASASAAQETPATTAPEPETNQHVPIFGSVSTTDVLAAVKEHLLAASPEQGSRIALEADGIAIRGLDAGEDRIKRLGTFEVAIGVGRSELKPVVRTIEVVAEE
ncbi:hypothetical protein F5Y15DRAFT_413033 [Xylariaceae sp. FL0016]|nr:hypothetical protein F5Y15DRAFT_413033 [Xylariaceae sp. FL0016]